MSWTLIPYEGKGQILNTIRGVCAYMLLKLIYGIEKRGLDRSVDSDRSIHDDWLTSSSSGVGALDGARELCEGIRRGGIGMGC